MAAEAAAAHSANNQGTSRGCCCCCFCRHGLSLGVHCTEARLAAALAASSSRNTSAVASYASLVLFAASVAVIMAKSGASTSQARGQTHSFHNHTRKRGYLGQQDRKERYTVKKSRKSRWEWRPVNRRSIASQTTDHEVEAEVIPPASASPAADQSATFVNEAVVPSLEDFPALAREIPVDPPAPRTADRIDPPTSKPTTSEETAEVLSNEDEVQPLNRKQRKYLKKRQKKLLAASHTLHLTSLPVLKSWKFSNKCYHPSASSPSPCKIYDCSRKSFELGSPSGKSIAWSFSSKPHDYLESLANTSVSRSSIGGSKVSSYEISEISESPKSYLGDWTDDSESFKRSLSDPEEIEMDVPSLDSEFEVDSEDYSLPAL